MGDVLIFNRNIFSNTFTVTYQGLKTKKLTTYKKKTDSMNHSNLIKFDNFLLKNCSFKYPIEKSLIKSLQFQFFNFHYIKNDFFVFEFSKNCLFFFKNIEDFILIFLFFYFTQSKQKLLNGLVNNTNNLIIKLTKKKNRFHLNINLLKIFSYAINYTGDFNKFQNFSNKLFFNLLKFLNLLWIINYNKIYLKICKNKNYEILTEKRRGEFAFIKKKQLQVLDETNFINYNFVKNVVDFKNFDKFFFFTNYPFINKISNSLQYPFNLNQTKKLEKKKIMTYRSDVPDIKNFSPIKARNVSIYNVKCLKKNDIINILGQIVCKNLVFEKSFLVRLTTDDWKTQLDIKDCFVYTGSTCNNLFDYFQFDSNIFVPEISYKDNIDIRLCLCYYASNNVFWDNKNNKNYNIQISCQPN